MLKDPEVRRAINEAIDRDALVRDGMAGRGRPADGPISPQNWVYSAPTAPLVFNPADARIRIEKIAARLGSKTRMAGSTKLAFKCLVFAQDPRFERLAALVQKQLADVGIDMRLEPVPQKELVKRAMSGDFDAYLFEMAGRSMNWVYEFWRYHDGGMNNTGYRSADAILDRIRAALTEEEVREGAVELQRVMHDDPPAAFLVWQEQTRAVSTKFDVAAEPNRDILTNLWQWRLAGPAKQASR